MLSYYSSRDFIHYTKFRTKHYTKKSWDLCSEEKPIISKSITRSCPQIFWGQESGKILLKSPIVVYNKYNTACNCDDTDKKGASL